MTTLNVGVGQKYTSINSAVSAAAAGDTVQIQAGTYLNDFTTITKAITLTAVDGPVVMSATTSPPNGKAILTIDASATVDGITFTGASVGDLNGAGIRYEAGDLVVRNCVFYDNQDGILGNAVAGGTILIDKSEFSHNGAGDGRSHNIYIGQIAKLTIQNSYFHDAIVGHEIKSRADTTIIQNNRIFDNGGSASYPIDLPNGGVAVVQNNIIEKGANAQNMWTIHYGGEATPNAGSNLLVTNNTIVNDKSGGGLIANQSGQPVVVSNNSLFGYGAAPVNSVPVTMTGNTTLASRPTLDGATLAPVPGAAQIPGGPPVNPQPLTSLPVPAGLAYVNYGTTGAVTASGRVLTVGGKNGQFTSLTAALAGSRDGDRIQVAAGTYNDEIVAIDKKVIIEGVGGLARFVYAGSKEGPRGLFTANTDATLRNLEITGANNWSGNMAGLYVAAGNVTVANSYIHDNNVGLAAAESSAITLGIFDSELSFNGDVDHGQHPVNIGAIGSLTIQRSSIHDAKMGHELKSKAWFTDIENTRIYDGATSPSSFLVDLGQGGQATLKNDYFYKGPNSQNGTLVHVGGEGPTYANTNVQVSGSTLVSNLQNVDHPWTYFVAGDDNGGVALPTVNVTSSRFVGGVSGSQTLLRATGSGNTSLAYGASGTTLDTSAPWSVAAAPAASTLKPTTGPNRLSVVLSGVIANANAQATILVDGQAVAGGVVTAANGTPGTRFDAYGWWTTGTHTVAVQFDNSVVRSGVGAFYLHVDSLTLDGKTAAPDAWIGLQNYGTTSWSTSLTSKTILPDFDATYYLANNVDVKQDGMDPLYHYLNYGWKEGRNPNALFNTNFYLSKNPGLIAANTNPLLHYEQTGWQQGAEPSFQFSGAKYLANNPDAVAANVDPLQSYLTKGQAAGRTLYAGDDPYVDNAYYGAGHPALATSGKSASDDYHNGGWTTNANPSAYFDTNYYLTWNPDVRAAGVDPLKHYETYGWKEGRDPSQWFVQSAYIKTHPGLATDPLLDFILNGNPPADTKTSAYAQPEAKVFDPAYYLAHNADVKAAGLDPLAHYELYGWREHRDPSASFSTDKYLAANPDVKAAGIDPLAHWANHGQSEGRSIFPA